MSKQEFLDKLRSKLQGLPKQEVEDRISFYLEMIDDRIEDGLTEEEAVSQIGSVDEIAAQIIADIPFTKIAKEKIKPKRRLKAWEITLLVLGSPIWLSLAVAAIAVIISLYAVLWSMIITLWAVFASVLACAPVGVIAGVIFICTGSGYTGVALISAGLVCAGLSILMFFGCKLSTKSILLLTKNIALGIKKCFVRKEEA